MANQEKYAFDDWVGTVRPDPKNTDQLTVLQGYLGESSEADHIRVYSDESLNNFVEVPEEAILYAVKLTPAESSLGGSKLWLRSDAAVTFGDPKLANRPRSTFLEGDIMQQYGTFGQPDTTQMAGFMAGQGDTTGRGGFMAGQGDTTGQGVYAMASAICQTVAQIQCQQITRNQVNCKIPFTQANNNCYVVITKQGIGCQIPCFGGTKIPGCGGYSVLTKPISLACNPGNPGGRIFQQPGAGFMMGQPDTTQMGGYYGTFNPYMY